MTQPTATRIDRVIAYALGVPWALEESRLRRVQTLLALRAGGEAWEQDEIEEMIAGRTARRHGGEVRRYGDGGNPGPMVAVVSLVGVMQHRADLMADASGGTSLQRFNAAIAEAAADDDVTAILIDIDSPGGEVNGVEESRQLVADATERKPVVAVANTMAASAAYWVASQATEVVIAPGGEVGSIGVWNMHVDSRGLLEQEGLAVTVVSAGEHKVERFPYLPLSDDAQAEMQRQVDEVYGRFVGAVAEGRDVSEEMAGGEQFGDGRMVGDERAVAAGMADRVATFGQVFGELVTAERSERRDARRGRSVARARLEMAERGMKIGAA